MPNQLALEIELDTRLVDLWHPNRLGAIVEDVSPELLEVIAQAIRGAYAVGYFDCAKDPNPGGFFKECGYPISMKGRAQ